MIGYIVLYLLLFLLLYCARNFKVGSFLQLKQIDGRQHLLLNKSQFLLFLSFWILVFWGGLRGDISIDISRTYYRVFNYYNETLLSHFDFLFRYIFSWIYENTGRFQDFLFLTTAIYITCIYIGVFKGSKNPTYSILLFLLFDYYYGGLNQIRQYLGMGFLLISIVLLQKMKYLASLGLIVIAGFFHSACFLFLIIFIADKVKLKIKAYTAILMFSPILLLIARPLINYIFQIYAGGQYYIYITNPHLDYGVIGKFLIPFFKVWFLALIYLLVYKNITEIPGAYVYLNLLLVACVVSLFGMINSEVVRVVNLFLFPQIIFIVNSSKIFLQQKITRYLFAFYIWIVFSYFVFSTYTHAIDYPYEFLTFI